MKQALSLLLVDDESLILKGLETTYDWRAFGYEIMGTARDGLIALDKIKQQVPDVVITDICMKNMDGISLIRKCSRDFPRIKFVILSAHQDFSYAKSACELGVYSYLLKPISEVQLRMTMKSLYNEYIENSKKISGFSIPDKTLPTQKKDSPAKKLAVALDYISKNLSDSNLTMQQVANEFHYNYNYFGRLFKSCVGISFNDYIRELRLNRAASLLAANDISIIDIACIVGISNQSYFSSLFKCKFDMTPREYRKNNKNE